MAHTKTVIDALRKALDKLMTDESPWSNTLTGKAVAFKPKEQNIQAVTIAAARKIDTGRLCVEAKARARFNSAFVTKSVAYVVEE